jgi:hypothetical protein
LAEEPRTGVLEERRPDGTFQKGKSGNPLGRPKGSKNQITLLKQALELQLREQAEPEMAEVLQTAIALAKEGNVAMIKLLLEMHMSKGSSDEAKASEKVAIQINSMAPPEQKKGDSRPSIDGTVENVNVIDIEETQNGRHEESDE